MCDNAGSSGHLTHYLHNLLSILSAIFKQKHKATNNNVGNRVIENDSIHIKRF